ncbi:MAG: 23S rRNA (pseudouridine(1915)-N(3))-methyltransferase RlmH [Sulfuricella sp.]|jgi:23S rRNA (pseudouridine1915-N3)-methyltransferase|nr:23S rRNA (pseudouridine(1915)-N(3))-methyltransferase RlmH [Sulfuricella sp.]
MKLWILAVGNKMPSWVDGAFGEYAKRMPREARIELLEIKPEKRAAGKTVEQMQEAEMARLLAALPAGAHPVMLDERGSEMTTLELAVGMKSWLQEGRDVAFIIGGADGLHPALRQRAGKLWSLSRLTLPHGLVRVLLAEQLYRAMSVLQNHPYHRE